MKPLDSQLSKSAKYLKQPAYGAKFKLTIPDFKTLTDQGSPHSLQKKTNRTPEPEKPKGEEAKELTPLLDPVQSQRTLPPITIRSVKDLHSAQLKEKYLPALDNSATQRIESHDLTSQRLLKLSQRESAQFQNPSLKSTRETSKFDC